MELCSIVYFYLQHINPDKMKAKYLVGLFGGLLRWD